MFVDEDELRQALEHPWERWGVFPHPSQNDISALYEAILGRAPSVGEIAAWEPVLADSSLSALATDMAGTPEAQNDIGALYEAILGRTPSGGEIAQRSRGAGRVSISAAAISATIPSSGSTMRRMRSA